MNKYIIEGGVDFYEELYKSLDIEETNEKTEEDNNLCLITNEPLTDNYVKLNCGHKFNYIPLYYDIKNHKQKFNGLESTASRLTLDEIRCPYCRTKQTGVLPYYADLNLAKINGVNYNSSHISSCCSYKKCSFKELNPNYDPSGNNPVETHNHNIGNYKFFTCLSLCSFNSLVDGNNYCWKHKKSMIKKAKEEAKLKEKEEAMNMKLQAKEEKKKAKEEAKLKEKEEKKKAKDEAKLKEKEEKKAKDHAKLKEKEEKKAKEAKLKEKK
jgi:hypothetical protein